MVFSRHSLSKSFVILQMAFRSHQNIFFHLQVISTSNFLFTNSDSPNGTIHVFIPARKKDKETFTLLPSTSKFSVNYFPKLFYFHSTTQWKDTCILISLLLPEPHQYDYHSQTTMTPSITVIFEKDVSLDGYGASCICTSLWMKSCSRQFNISIVLR